LLASYSQEPVPAGTSNLYRIAHSLSLRPFHCDRWNVWLWRAWLDWHSVEYLLNCLELVAIVSVFALFFYARWASSRWLVARVRAELMRQWQYLEVAFPTTFTVTPENIKAEFDREVDQVSVLVEN
jgi:hypothetical protein